MKLQKILSIQAEIQSLFTLSGDTNLHETTGDSYTSTGFNSSLRQPSLQSPMGNPPLATDGINWVGYAVNSYNSSVTFSYNFATFGATLNNSLVEQVPRDVIHQVDDFCSHYCHSTTWEPKSSIFGFWIGINDVYFTFDGDDPSTMPQLAMDSYFRLLDHLHQNCGARHFLVINVPPIARTPQFRDEDPLRRQRLHKATLQFNNLLDQTVRQWRMRNQQV
ncbi:hypothetical protein FE257_007265 [Aspergillus nanangensis]|uniref:Carbohydrate esterase family 16 protein n=1 Tax=Aspergillus nanangensis TaxID=2582783 RepID=A0AAD4GUD8_ASPNN|nr:hypothetical protein FE257_007265 [Aspergillus nanangensis]